MKKNKMKAPDLFEKFLIQYENKIERLKNDVLKTDTSLCQGKKTIFISICNGSQRAAVIKANGDSLIDAWNTVVLKGGKYIKNNNIKPLWIKVDVVTSIASISYELYKRSLGQYRPYFLRKGLALDENLDISFLEAELNCNAIIDYTKQELHLDNLNHYLKKRDDLKINTIPMNLYIFEAKGFFAEDLSIYELNTSEIDYGRRPASASYDEILSYVNTGSKFLFDSLLPNGRFIYGYQPFFNKEIKSYNILRHTTTTWTLLNQYKMTKDESLVEKIDRAIEYMTSSYIEEMNENTSYLIERETGEIKLGGNGVAVVVLCVYMEIFNTPKYKNVLRILGNVILDLQDKKTGEYFHVLSYPEFSPKEKHRTVYYDGEATFALSKLYSLTGDNKWLEAAKLAVDNFISNHYEKHVDHWVAYSINELSKHISEEKYLSFGLMNAQVNLDRIYNRDTSFHTYMEMLMITFELLTRIKDMNLNISYLKESFDENKFKRTIFKRANHMLNGYLYPEYAMYYKSPMSVLGSFCVRHHSHRVRIDDVQHFLGGYYLYLQYYDKLSEK